MMRRKYRSSEMRERDNGAEGTKGMNTECEGLRYEESHCSLNINGLFTLVHLHHLTVVSALRISFATIYLLLYLFVVYLATPF
jgi:hypothetical protein